MPDAEPGNSGELVGLFNKWPFQRFVLVNIIDKAIGYSRFYRGHIPRRLDRAGYLQKVDMEVGNLHLFRGYRSLHGKHAVRIGCLTSHAPTDRAKRCQPPYGSGSRCAVWAKSVPARPRRAGPRLPVESKPVEAQALQALRAPDSASSAAELHASVSIAM
jgi:hypothetical protein